MIERYCISFLGEWTAIYGLFLCLFARKVSNNIVSSVSCIFLLCEFAAYQYLNTLGILLSPSCLLSTYFGSINIYYWDSLSSAMVLMNLIVSVVVLLYTMNANKKDIETFSYFWISIGILNILFMTQHALVFFIAFECVLIPFGFWILGDRSAESFIALRQFVMYTAFGSIFLLFGLCYTFVETGQVSWIFSDLSLGPYGAGDWAILTFSFLVPFLIKLPIWPLHGWLPLAHTQAPTQASVILASSVLKIGGYGLLRLLPFLTKTPHHLWSLGLILIGLCSLVITAMSAYTQKKFKKIIAYSSIVHMAWVTIGVGLLLNPEVNRTWVFQAIVIQMMAHALVSAGLFILIGLLYERTHAYLLEEYRALGSRLPVLAKYLSFFTLANASLPMTAGFIGEFMIFVALYQAYPYLAPLALLSFFLNSAYNLRYLNIFLADQRKQHQRFSGISDANFLENMILLFLCISIVSLGICPAAYLRFIGLGP